MTQYRLIGAIKQLRERQLLEPGYFTKTWTGRILVGIMVIGGIIELILILLDINSFQWVNREKSGRTKRDLIRSDKNGVYTMTVKEGVTTTMQLDICSINCPSNWHFKYSTKRYNRYLCGDPTCSSWSSVWWTTDKSGYYNRDAVVPESKKDLVSRLSISQFVNNLLVLTLKILKALTLGIMV